MALQQMCRTDVAYKNELLFSRGINYDKLPSWQKRGVGMWIEEYGKEEFNPITGETKMTTRKRIHVDYELPLGDEYGSFIRKFT
jgi:tRNA(His) 5'-end guanylyltransferase